MTTKVQRWGNSLAFRIPKAYAKDIHLMQGSTVEIFVESGRLVIEPSKKFKYSLKKLLKGMNKKNFHAEFDMGGPVGQEVW